MREITRHLVKFVSKPNYDDIQPEVIVRAKLLMRDLVDIGVRPRHEADSTLAMMWAMEVPLSRIPCMGAAGEATAARDNHELRERVCERPVRAYYARDQYGAGGRRLR